MGAQPGELVLGHAELFEVVEHLLQAGGDQKIAPRRQPRTKNSNTAVSAMPSSKYACSM